MSAHWPEALTSRGYAHIPSNSLFVDLESADPNPRGYVPNGEFEAIKIPDGDYVIISNCRKSDSMPEECWYVIRDGGLKIGDRIMTLYLKGTSYELPSDSEVQTAAGMCVYFLYDLKDHDPFTKIDELRIKKSAKFYYSTNGSREYVAGNFEDLTNVLSAVDDLGVESSIVTGHTLRGINLL